MPWVLGMHSHVMDMTLVWCFCSFGLCVRPWKKLSNIMKHEPNKHVWGFKLKSAAKCQREREGVHIVDS